MQRATDSGSVSLIEGRGATGLKWIAAVVFGVFMCVCMSTYVCDCVCLRVHLCFCVPDHVYTISECLPCRWTIQQADRFIGKEPDGCRTVAGAKPAKKSPDRPGGLFVSVACCWQNRGLICAHSPAFAVHLTSVTFGCSTKDSGVILGMSIWIWQQHGRKGVRHTHVHVHTITFNSLNRQYPRFSWVLWLLWLKQIPIPIDSYRYHSS